MNHKEIASKLFNDSWDLLEKEDKTKDEEALLIHKVHASLYHWIEEGSPLNIQRGEWMVSHVYASMKRQEPALYHAERCLNLTKQYDIDDYDFTLAYEAYARAYNISNDPDAKIFLDIAYDSLDQIKKKDDLIYVKTQLDEIKKQLPNSRSTIG